MTYSIREICSTWLLSWQNCACLCLCLYLWAWSVFCWVWRSTARVFGVIIRFLFCKPIRKDHDWPLAVQSSPLSMVTQQLNYTCGTAQSVSLPYSLSTLSSSLTHTLMHACTNCNWCKFESLYSFSTCSLLNEVNFIKWNILLVMSYLHIAVNMWEIE